MNINITTAPFPIEFGLIKSVIEKLEITDSSGQIGKYIQAFFPFEDKPYLNRSLSDSISSQDQLRYYLSDHVQRNIRIIAYIISQRHRNININIRLDAQALSATDKMFMEEFRKFSQITLTISSTVDISVCVLPPEEKHMVSLLRNRDNESNTPESDINFLKKCITIYMKAGDAWTADNILRFIGVDAYGDPSAFYNISGTCCRMKGEMERAALYYQKSMVSNGKLYHITDSFYGLSMICLRHHRKEFLDIKRGEELLQESFRRLSSEKDKSDRNTFAKVFNRNGYALVLFRSGNITQSIEILHDCLSILSKLRASAINIMHQSVILYNLAQCHTSLNQIEHAREAYEKCLELDPNHAEYRLNLAKILLKAGDKTEAERQVIIASKLDPFSPEVYLLLGVCSSLADKKIKVLSYYKKAYALDPFSLENLYRLLYSMSEYGLYEEVIYYIFVAKKRIVSSKIYADFGLLEAEAYLNMGSSGRALSILEKLSTEYPDNENIRKSMTVVADNS